jgi:hypothetical protein
MSQNVATDLQYLEPEKDARFPTNVANVADIAGSAFVMARTLIVEAIHDPFPWQRRLFADCAYAGVKALAKFGNWSIEIVRSMADTIGFEVLPRRWVVERMLAWLNHNRRLTKDFEATSASARGLGSMSRPRSYSSGVSHAHNSTYPIKRFGH